ncbi:MAG: GTP 3',8-cyclase [Candidatus Poribacteria bacterium]|nr:MAG: GTP 3',8-cyclase [Candidatus Poribacteria bacterium]
MSRAWTSIPNTWPTARPEEERPAELPRRLVDRFGREVHNLRISVTDRCNFRCIYCMPERVQFLPREEVLTFEEIVRVVRIVQPLGIRKLRLTGGEPLVRREIEKLVAQLSAIPGIEDLAMTTNGIFLKELAQPLKKAGLTRLNVSLDSLDRETFAQLTRRDALEQVLEGIEAALEAGFVPLKVNVVAMKGITERELLDFARLAREKPLIVRFIEFMPLDGEGIWSMDRVLSREEILRRIDAVYPLEPVDERGAEPAERFRFRDGRGEIGVIASVTHPFCHACDRIRLTAEGKLRTCLFSLKETDLRALLRGGADDETIAETILQAVWNKEPGHAINRPEFVKPERNMFQIGG